MGSKRLDSSLRLTRAKMGLAVARNGFILRMQLARKLLGAATGQEANVTKPPSTTSCHPERGSRLPVLATILALAATWLPMHGALASPYEGNSETTQPAKSTSLLVDERPSELLAGPPAKLYLDIGAEREAEAAEQARAAAAATLLAAEAAATLSIPSLGKRQLFAAGSITGGFGLRRHPISGDIRPHSGVDVAAPVGTPILATADGKVKTAAWQGTYGLLVSIDHSKGVQTRYAHMAALNVIAGQRVRRGDVIGFVGSTGRSTGPHLHYEMRIKGQAIDPLRR